MIINLFDFDQTIYDGDSTRDFLLFSCKRHPKMLILIPGILYNVIKYILGMEDKTTMKEYIYRFLTFIPNIDKEVKAFWDTHEKYIKDYYYSMDRRNHIIISASPEFLLKPIAKRLEVMELIASKVNKKTGKYDGINCHDVEKVRRLNELYKDYVVEETYSDDIKADEPILKLAKHPFIVKGNRIIPADF